MVGIETDRGLFVTAADHGAPGSRHPRCAECRAPPSDRRCRNRSRARRVGRTAFAASSRWRGRAYWSTGVPNNPPSRRRAGAARRSTARVRRESRRCDLINPSAALSPAALRIFSANTGVYSIQWPSASMTGWVSSARTFSGCHSLRALISSPPQMCSMHCAAILNGVPGVIPGRKPSARDQPSLVVQEESNLGLQARCRWRGRK